MTLPHCQEQSELSELAVRSDPLIPCGDMASADFRALLRSLVQRYGTKDALGKLIGMSGSRVGRAIDGQYSFNITNCLKLSKATGAPASQVLRAAGKGDVADLIESLYGAERVPEREESREPALVAALADITAEQLQALKLTVQGFQAANQASGASPGRSGVRVSKSVKRAKSA